MEILSPLKDRVRRAEPEVAPPMPVGGTLVDLFTDRVSRWPDRPALRYAEDGEWRPITWREYGTAVREAAAGLAALGIEPGDRVGILSGNQPRWHMADVAILSCGGISVPAYPTGASSQVAHVFGHSGSRACFVGDRDHLAKVLLARTRLPALERVILLGDLPDGLDDEFVMTFDDLCSLGRQHLAQHPGDIDDRARDLDAGSVATIVYTSGTTGPPKGCVLTHRNMYAEVANAVAALHQLFHKGSATLLFLPLAHGFARLLQIGVVQARARMGYSSDVRNLVPDLRSFQPTFVLAVPRVFEKVFNAARQRARAEHKGAIFEQAERAAMAYSRALETPAGPGLPLRARHALFDRLVYGRIRAGLGGHCTAAISGGAPLGERLSHFFRGIGVNILEGYGLTETSPAVAVNTHSHTRVGTVGNQ